MSQINEFFTFSPGAKTIRSLIVAVNLGFRAREEDCVGGLCKIIYSTNPFDDWLLCGINGSCMNLEPMAMLGGGEHRVVNCPIRKGREDSLNNKRVVFKPTPVCVYTPFVFIVGNASSVFDGILCCSNDTCFYRRCWDVRRFNIAVVARKPRWVPIPVNVLHTMTLFRQKRDFGITAAIVTAISLAAVGATAAAVAMSQSVQTAHALSNLSSSVAHAIDVQSSLNGQLKGGLMVINQRIDLVQEQIETLWQLAQLGCQWKYSSLCITNI